MMKRSTCIVAVLFAGLLHGQTPELIFHSGFEPATTIAISNSSSTDILGIDASVAAPNDWVQDLESDSHIGFFNIQYQGGDDTMRLAELVADPTNPANQALSFWLRYPNVGGTKGRVQANLYDGQTGFTNLLYSIRLYLPHDLDTLKYYPGEIDWFTLMEFWNNPNWTGDPYPFRLSVDLQKPGQAPGPLRFGVYGEIGSGPDNWTTIWSSFNTEFEVPIGQWMTIDIHYVEGDGNTGLFYMAATPDGDSTTVIFNLSAYTRHPADPAPDGLTHFNPFKLYTSAELINAMRGMGKLVQVLWDDFALWDGTGLSTNLNGHTGLPPACAYPNPFSRSVTIAFHNPEHRSYTFALFDALGRRVYFAEGITSNQVELTRNNLPAGIYRYTIQSGQHALAGQLIAR